MMKKFTMSREKLYTRRPMPGGSSWVWSYSAIDDSGTTYLIGLSFREWMAHMKRKHPGVTFTKAWETN